MLRRPAVAFLLLLVLILEKLIQNAYAVLTTHSLGAVNPDYVCSIARLDEAGQSIIRGIRCVELITVLHNGLHQWPLELPEDVERIWRLCLLLRVVIYPML